MGGPLSIIGLEISTVTDYFYSRNSIFVNENCDKRRTNYFPG